MSPTTAVEQIIERMVTARRLSSCFLAEADGLMGALFRSEPPELVEHPAAWLLRRR